MALLLVIDEAHLLDHDRLESVRMLGAATPLLERLLEPADVERIRSPHWS